MRYESGQFGSFCGRDNRKSVMDLFVRMGEGVPDQVARSRRAGFLSGLLQGSKNGFAGKPILITPCDAVAAYHCFVAITGVLGVSVEQAAKILENTVRRQRYGPT